MSVLSGFQCCFIGNSVHFLYVIILLLLLHIFYYYELVYIFYAFQRKVQRLCFVSQNNFF